MIISEGNFNFNVLNFIDSFAVDMFLSGTYSDPADLVRFMLRKPGDEEDRSNYIIPVRLLAASMEFFPEAVPPRSSSTIGAPPKWKLLLLVLVADLLRHIASDVSGDRTKRDDARWR